MWNIAINNTLGTNESYFCDPHMPIYGYGTNEAQVNLVCKIVSPKKIIFNPPATIVYWSDNTKTVVKCDPSSDYSEYYGFCAACAKRLIGGNSKIKNAIDKADRVEKKCRKSKQNTK